MAKFFLEDVLISGISCAVPDNRVFNTSFYDSFGKDYVRTFVETTGVVSTCRSKEEQTASDLCYIAAENLIRKKNIDRQSIGLIVFISQTPDYRLPATACVLHKRLELSNKCLAFDVNLGCSGFVYGLNIVGSMMQSLDIDYALLLNGDTCVKTNSPLDKSTIMLFGDAGCATLLAKQRGSKLVGELMTDGCGFKTIIMPSGAYRNRNGSREQVKWADGNIRSDYDGFINGTDVFSFSITQVPRLVKNFLQENGVCIDDVDAFVLHQANLLILKQIAKKIKIPMEKLPISIDRFGNTSGASIPLTLCDFFGEDDSMGNAKILMSGFGVGLSWGVAYAYIDKKNIFPIVYTDDHYTEGAVSHD